MRIIMCQMQNRQGKFDGFVSSTFPYILILQEINRSYNREQSFRFILLDFLQPFFVFSTPRITSYESLTLA